MESSASTTPRHDKLYVLAQCAGWGALTLGFLGILQLVRRITLDHSCVIIASNLIGLLLSHGYRMWINRRGWKNLAWQKLLSRVLISVLVLSILWTLANWPLDRLLQNPPTNPKLSVVAIFIFSVFQTSWIFFLWSLLYFGYHSADRYRRSEIERAKLAALVKEAELRALKSQVNPHFIFNALNSLRALIDEDPGRARLAVTQLANLLRYSLQSGQLETVPFEDELRTVKDYLALEQVRHEERLQLRLDIDPTTHELAVPPMLLQTLVENAVKYGVSNRPEGGEIAIISRCDDQGLVLRVTNPGTLPVAGAQRSTRALNSTGVGLRNAAERLSLLFGQNASLELRAEGSDTIVAEARIPQTVNKPAILTSA